ARTDGASGPFGVQVLEVGDRPVEGGSGRHARASAKGPRASAGKKVRAATRTTVPQTRTPKRTPCVGRVPAPGSTRRCAATDPASAGTARIGTNRPKSIASPRVVWKNGLVTVSPAKAL